MPHKLSQLLLLSFDGAWVTHEVRTGAVRRGSTPHTYQHLKQTARYNLLWHDSSVLCEGVKTEEGREKRICKRDSVPDCGQGGRRLNEKWEREDPRASSIRKRRRRRYCKTTGAHVVSSRQALRRRAHTNYTQLHTTKLPPKGAPTEKRVCIQHRTWLATGRKIGTQVGQPECPDSSTHIKDKPNDSMAPVTMLQREKTDAQPMPPYSNEPRA